MHLGKEYLRGKTSFAVTIIHVIVKYLVEKSVLVSLMGPSVKNIAGKTAFFSKNSSAIIMWDLAVNYSYEIHSAKPFLLFSGVCPSFSFSFRSLKHLFNHSFVPILISSASTLCHSYILDAKVSRIARITFVVVFA